MKVLQLPLEAFFYVVVWTTVTQVTDVYGCMNSANFENPQKGEVIYVSVLQFLQVLNICFHYELWSKCCNVQKMYVLFYTITDKFSCLQKLVEFFAAQKAIRYLCDIPLSQALSHLERLRKVCPKNHCKCKPKISLICFFMTAQKLSGRV